MRYRVLTLACCMWGCFCMPAAEYRCAYHVLGTFDRCKDAEHVSCAEASLLTASALLQVQGSYNISRLVAQTRPQVVIPLNNNEFPSSGPISKMIWSLESSENLADRLQDAAIRGVRVEQSKPPGQPLELKL